MRTICLVNNYNYGKYLPEALASIERQTRLFDQVIIIDDGSSDDSHKVIASYCDRLPAWQVLLKKNGGQLSCFNAALPFIENDDLVTLLDADDVYPIDYLKELMEKAEQIPADFYFCEKKAYKDGQVVINDTAKIESGVDYVIESSSALARHFKVFIGRATSTLAIKGYLYKALFPYPFEKDWITRADDIIVHGSSILNARKAYLGTLCVRYRMHDENSFYGKTFNEAYKLRREHHLEKLYGWYCNKYHLNTQVRKKLAEREYYLIPESLRRTFSLPKTFDKSNKQKWLKKWRSVFSSGRKPRE